MLNLSYLDESSNMCIMYSQLHQKSNSSNMVIDGVILNKFTNFCLLFEFESDYAINLFGAEMFYVPPQKRNMLVLSCLGCSIDLSWFLCSMPLQG